MLNSKFKFFTIFFMLSTAFVLSTGCKKGEASCKGIWDKINECTKSKNKEKKIQKHFGSKDEFIKRCEKVKDDEDIKGLMKAAAEGCDELNSYLGKNRETIKKLRVKKQEKKEEKK